MFQSDYAGFWDCKLTRGIPIQVTPAGDGTIDAYGHTVSMEVLENVKNRWSTSPITPDSAAMCSDAEVGFITSD